MIYLIMGVSGSGKTTIGKRLAEQLSLPYFEADNFHPESNIRKMENGHPLTDEDRWPWLDAIARQISEQYSSGAGGVFSSSALKEIYRQRLKVIPEDQISWIYLHAPKSVLQERLEQRKGHFFDPALLDSQFETLEPPAYGVHQDVSGSIAEIMNELLVQIT